MGARGSAVYVFALLVVAAGCGDSPIAPQAAVAVTQVQPAGVAIGATVTVLGSGFSTTGNTVKLGSGYLVSSVAATTPTALQFTLPSYLRYCPPGPGFCQANVIIVQPGPYQLTVTNEKGTSNAVTLQVLPQ
jgi:hypothetical protein